MTRPTLGILTAATALFVTLSPTLPLAQRGPSVSVTPVVESDGVHAGTTVKLALRVSLPDGVHVQSDKPRDPMLIPTRLTVEPPAGVTTSEVLYPPPTDFVQKGQAAPLAVFEQQFVVGVAVALARDVAPGIVQVPVRLRYQACDASTCFVPSRQDTTFALRVVPPAEPIKKIEPALFAQLRFSH